MARTHIAALSLALVLSACDEPAPPPPAAVTTPTTAPVEVTALDAAATPLREWFEANAGKPRFITIVSPT